MTSRWMVLGLALLSGCMGAYRPSCGTVTELHPVSDVNALVGLSGEELLAEFEGDHVATLEDDDVLLDLAWSVNGLPGDASWWAPGPTEGPKRGQAVLLIAVTCTDGVEVPAMLELTEASTQTSLRTSVELSASTVHGGPPMGTEGVLELNGTFPVEELDTAYDWRSELREGGEIESMEGYVRIRQLDGVVIEAEVGVSYSGVDEDLDAAFGGVVRIFSGVPLDESPVDTGAEDTADTGAEDTAHTGQ